ncbi:MAG: neutral zinc metallopeptidase [Planctomycetota bacterium]
MRWRGREGSSNVEDRRGRRPKASVVGGGGIGVLLLALLVMFLGGDPRGLLQQAAQNRPEPAAVGPNEPVAISQQDRERGEFASVVLADSEKIWNDLFRRSRLQYREPTMVLFSDVVNSGCGQASAASGPFYCPADEKVYLDTSFFDQLSRQLGAPGDFAQAYVVAHEVGHHVQNILGKTDELNQLRRRLPENEYNRYSVRLELQADFYAGVMFHHAQQRWSILEPGDIEEGLRAAAAIGDDTLQKRSRGFADQESFTHGTSEQRVKWFKLGLQTGDPSKGDTFAISDARL